MKANNLPLLQVKDLCVEYHIPAGVFRAVDKLSFSLEKGKSLGIVGESGCGKTTAMLARLRLLPESGRIVEGEVFVTYEEGKIKYIQDANCGIMVTDDHGDWAAILGEGQGMTHIKGRIDKSGIQMTFTPVCCYTPNMTTSGNVINPIELTFDEYYAQAYLSNAYESTTVTLSIIPLKSRLEFITPDDQSAPTTRPGGLLPSAS